MAEERRQGKPKGFAAQWRPRPGETVEQAAERQAEARRQGGCRNERRHRFAPGEDAKEAGRRGGMVGGKAPNPVFAPRRQASAEARAEMRGEMLAEQVENAERMASIRSLRQRADEMLAQAEALERTPPAAVPLLPAPAPTPKSEGGLLDNLRALGERAEAFLQGSSEPAPPPRAPSRAAEALAKGEALPIASSEELKDMASFGDKLRETLRKMGAPVDQPAPTAVPSSGGGTAEGAPKMPPRPRLAARIEEQRAEREAETMRARQQLAAARAELKAQGSNLAALRNLREQVKKSPFNE